eukprot:366870-Amphidinium_carterae.1
MEDFHALEGLPFKGFRGPEKGTFFTNGRTSLFWVHFRFPGVGQVPLCLIFLWVLLSASDKWELNPMCGQDILALPKT